MPNLSDTLLAVQGTFARFIWRPTVITALLLLGLLAEITANFLSVLAFALEAAKFVYTLMARAADFVVSAINNNITMGLDYIALAIKAKFGDTAATRFANIALLAYSSLQVSAGMPLLGNLATAALSSVVGFTFFATALVFSASLFVVNVLNFDISKLRRQANSLTLNSEEDLEQLAIKELSYEKYIR